MTIYIGIDWSERKHDVVFLNPAGAVVAALTVEHTPKGLLEIEKVGAGLAAASECVVGLETAHNLMIDFLWSRGYRQVYVIPPNVVRSTRGRYRQSGARDDQSDARLVADLLRTDRARLLPWQPDSVLTRQMRAQVSLLLHLTRNSVRLSNRLRAVLLRYHPAVLQGFGDLSSRLALEFIRAYPTPQSVSDLKRTELEAFARELRYSRPTYLPGCLARLQAPCPIASSETVQVYQQEAVCLASLLLTMAETRKNVRRQLGQLFARHPDQAIFASLPGAGELLAPALLVKFGDDRQRFPTPASVQALAGTCPVTVSSGQSRRVRFRRACDKEFRHIAQQWAMHSLSRSTWANAYWEQVRPHCDSNSHAYRCLANRWLAIAWKLWQTRQPYDEAYHLQQRARRSQPRA